MKNKKIYCKIKNKVEETIFIYEKEDDMESYSHLLKQLLQFSDTKAIILANVLGYDISYISKWCNGAKIPSAKNLHAIHKKMSALFAKEIANNKQETSFFLEFNLDLPKEKDSMRDREFLESSIHNLLTQAYYQENPNPEITQEEDIKFVVGKEEISVFFEKKFKPLFLQGNISKLEIFMTLDFTVTDVSEILSLFSKLKWEDTSVYISLGVNLEQLEENSHKKMNQLFHILNRYINLNIEIYSNKHFQNMNTILVKDYFAFQYSLDSLGEIQSLTWIQNKLFLHSLSRFTLDAFKKEDKLLGLVNTKKLQKEGYRTTFYTSDSYNFFLVQGFEFLLPPTIIDNIANYAKEKKYSEQDLISILKVKIAWEEIFENSSINFFILKNSIFRYLEKGELTYMNIHYKTSIEERKMHYEYAMKILEKNPKIHFHVIEDEFVEKSNFVYNIGVFGNYKKMFFKNYYNLEQQKEPYFTIVNNSKILKHIHGLFDKIRLSKYCTEYHVEELKVFWEKYGNMFFRLTNL